MFSGTHSAPSVATKSVAVAADALTEPDIVKGDHPRSASRTGGEARLGGQRMHKSRDGRGENEGKGAFLLRKGFQRESFTLVERTREGTREGRHAAAVESALLAQSGPARPPLCILGSAVLPGQQHSARGSTRLPRNSNTTTTTTTTTASARRNRVSQSAATALARQNLRLQNGIRVHGVSRERAMIERPAGDRRMTCEVPLTFQSQPNMCVRESPLGSASAGPCLQCQY